MRSMLRGTTLILTVVLLGGLGATAAPADALIRASVGGTIINLTSQEADDGIRDEVVTVSEIAPVMLAHRRFRIVTAAYDIDPGTLCTALNANTVNCDVPGTPGVTFDLKGGHDHVTANVSVTTTTIAGPGNDTTVGGSGPDVFDGGSGARTPGNDNGSDTFIGNGGIDTADYSDRTDNLALSLDDTANDGRGDEGDDVGSDIENVLTGSGSDTVVGSATGGTIDTGSGDDTIDGGAGPDVLLGGPGSDTVTYAGRNTGVDVDPTGTGDDGSTTDGPPGVRDTLGPDVERAIGTNGPDTMTAGGALTRLRGGPGADDLRGGTVTATLEGEGGTDTLTAAPSAGGELLGGADADTLQGGGATDVLDGGPGDDVLRGGGGADFLGGGEDDDRLFGDDGVDSLIGGSGDDELDGGPGADTLLGQAGADLLTTRDGVVDTRIDCGADVDAAVVDEGDPEAVDCEGVDRPGPVVAPDPGAGTGTAPPAVPTTGAGPPVPPPSATPLPTATPLTPSPVTIARSPAKIRVLRAGIRDGRLDMRVQITSRATGRIVLEYHAAGRRTRFTVDIPEGAGDAPTTWSFTRRLPAAQRRTTTGIVTLAYAGDTSVRPDEVRLRAASGKALLTRSEARIDAQGRLRVAGTASRRAVGVVRIRLGYVGTDGRVVFLHHRARITARSGGRASTWSIAEKLPGAAAAAGGQLSIQFTGYLPRRIRGEQTSKAVAP